jgi:hypothetical protein
MTRNAQLARLLELFKEHARPASWSKYYGNWYGNRLTVTICVNAQTLLFSHSRKQRFA